jgi:hypothetical protein
MCRSRECRKLPNCCQTNVYVCNYAAYAGQNETELFGTKPELLPGVGGPGLAWGEGRPALGLIAEEIILQRDQ